MDGYDGTFMGRTISDLTIGKILEQNALIRGDKVYLHSVSENLSFTYRDVDHLSRRWACSLLRLGVTKGVHVGLLMENSADMLILYLALARCGAVVVSINPAARGVQLNSFVESADVSWMVADAQHSGEAVELCNAGRLKAVIVRGGDGEQEAVEASRILAFSTLADADEAIPLPDVSSFDVACLAFTSGTTGPSKAVVFTHATMMLVALSYATSYPYLEDDVHYICLPLFHTSCLRGAAYVALLTGGSIALASSFSVTRFWQDIIRSGATTFDLLGAMADFLWRAPPQPDEAFHRVRFCRLAPVPQYGRAFAQRFNLGIASTYGLTDGGAPVAFTPYDPESKLGSCGKVRPGWAVRVVDENDFTVAPNVVGEIVIRSDVPWMMASGYYKQPEATNKAWRNGWFHTGDLGFTDAEGFLYFKDRAKDVIRRRGENVSAWEVEQLLLSHPSIISAAVYPVSSAFGEDEVAASIILEADADFDEAEIRDFCRMRILHFMVPEFIEQLSIFPLTISQKIDKIALRQLHEQKLGK